MQRKILPSPGQALQTTAPQQVPTPADAVAALLASRGESLAPEPVASTVGRK